MPGLGSGPLSSFFESWIPRRFNKEIPSILDRTQETIKSLDSSIRTDISKRIRQLTVNNAAMDTQIMNYIDNRLAKVEGNIMNLDRKITNTIDLGLIGVETFAGPQIRTAIGPVFGQPPAGIINVPFPICPPPIECKPPDEICPPPEPCPDKPPCIYVDIYKRPCKERDNICMYMVPSGHGPLSFDDITIAVEVTCDPTIGFIFEKEKYFCNELPLCRMQIIQIPGCPPQPIGTFPNPIINIQQGPGGQIINEQPPINQLQPSPYPPIQFPPYTQPVSPGSIINIAMLNPPPPQQQSDCMPQCDMSFYLFECEDGKRIDDCWNKMIGQLPSQFMQDKNAFDWWRDETKDKDEWIPIEIDFHDDSLISLGRE